MRKARKRSWISDISKKPTIECMRKARKQSFTSDISKVHFKMNEHRASHGHIATSSRKKRSEERIELRQGMLDHVFMKISFENSVSENTADDRVHAEREQTVINQRYTGKCIPKWTKRVESILRPYPHASKERAIGDEEGVDDIMFVTNIFREEYRKIRRYIPFSFEWNRISKWTIRMDAACVHMSSKGERSKELTTCSHKVTVKTWSEDTKHI